MVSGLSLIGNCESEERDASRRVERDELEDAKEDWEDSENTLS